MATLTKRLLSGSTNGKSVLVTATATTGTTIHTAVDGADAAVDIDFITLWASNSSASSVVLSIEWGETTASKLIVQTIPAQSGRFPLIENEPLNEGLVVTAFAATGSVIAIGGSVTRQASA